MSRSRTLGAGYAMLMAAGSIAAAVAQSAMRDKREAISPFELERRQRAARGPTRGQRKVVKRAAVGELHQVSKGQIVLGHIHPRWLRAEVARLLDADVPLSGRDIEAIRRAGPEVAALNAQRDRRYVGSDLQPFDATVSPADEAEL